MSLRKHGDFGLNAEHPPLVKFLAALPLLTMNLKEPPLLDQPYRLQEVQGGTEFVFQNDANAILFRARMAASVLTILGQALDANGEFEKAAPYYQKALTLAKTVEPQFQSASIAGLEHRLGSGKRGHQRPNCLR